LNKPTGASFVTGGASFISGGNSGATSNINVFTSALSEPKKKFSLFEGMYDTNKDRNPYSANLI
jgi:hypothetical protein